MSSNTFKPCPEVLRTETDSQGNKTLHLADGTTHTIPPGFQADCDNGKYHNVPTILTSPPLST